MEGEQQVHEQVESLPEMSLAVKTDYVSANTQVVPAPCWLYAVILVGGAAGANTLTLRDGFGTGADPKLVVGSAQYTTSVIILRRPIRFKQGLFANVTAGTCYATVQYKPDY